MTVSLFSWTVSLHPGVGRCQSSCRRPTVSLLLVLLLASHTLVMVSFALFTELFFFSSLSDLKDEQYCDCDIYLQCLLPFSGPFVGVGKLTQLIEEKFND